MIDQKPLKLKTENIEAVILPQKGGLLSSLRISNRDILYTAPDLDSSKSGWINSGCPLLFPFAGRCFHQGIPFKYQLGADIYNMPIHGFAYAKSFNVLKVTEVFASLELVSDHDTLTLFPFAFNLNLSYTLIHSGIKITIDLFNNSSSAMPIALGLHPYFKIPREYSQRHGLLLDTDAQECFQVTPAGTAGKSYPAKGPFSLEQPEFNSLILGKTSNPQAVLKSSNQEVLAKLDWRGAINTKYIVLWSPAEDGIDFYCIEPWMALPDAISTGAGLEIIQPGRHLVQDFTISL